MNWQDMTIGQKIETLKDFCENPQGKSIGGHLLVKTQNEQNAIDSAKAVKDKEYAAQLAAA